MEITSTGANKSSLSVLVLLSGTMIARYLEN
jgi:hypothetical protein